MFGKEISIVKIKFINLGSIGLEERGAYRKN